MLHKLEIKNAEIHLDGIKIKGVTGYEVKHQVKSSPVLTISLLIDDPAIDYKTKCHEVISEELKRLIKETGDTAICTRISSDNITIRKNTL